ncbi:MAG: tetratricopeptide repeat protein [Gammaproteobacteria bacterium]|nr:tetratricopeptide repeat protein [Gammaproteobacteria bacterium]
MGEVVIADDTVTGAGVIIAQRLEQLAETGGIVVQGSVAETVPDRLPFDFQSLGEIKLKGFEQPVRAFTVGATQSDDSLKSASNAPYLADERMGDNSRNKPAIAVLAFANMSNDPEQEFFGDGIAEDIITQLSKLSALVVIARTSTFAYKGKSVDIRQIGKDLEVSHVLEGSVRKSGNRIRVTAQLIDSSTGQHRWADRYDRELVDIFEVQDEIMREIVSALDVEILAGEQSRFWSDGTSNLQAWGHYRQARDLFGQFKSEHHPEVIRLLKKALEFDAEYSAAWHLLAGCYFHIEDDIRYSDAVRSEAKTFSREYLEKCIECDPTNPDAWSLRAMHHLTDGEFDKAVADTNKAAAMAPNHAIVIASSAAVLTKCGLPKPGLQRIRKAMRLCPVFPPWFYVHWGQTCRVLGKIDESIEAYQEMLRQDPDQLEGHIGLAGIFSESRDMKKAKKHADEVLRIDPGFSISRYFSSIAFRDQGIIARFAGALSEAGLPD